MPDAPLRILMVEDSPADGRLVQHELRQSGFNAEFTIVDDESSFRCALSRNPDIVLCDWCLPQFDAMSALKIARKQSSEVPFIIVSGSIGEEAAVSAIKLGANDYLLKDRLGRLGSAVRQAILQRDLRTAERKAREELRASEEQYRALADCIPQIVWTARPSGEIDYLNRWAEEYSGVGIDAIGGWSWEHQIHPDDFPRTIEVWTDVLKTGVPRDIEFRIRRIDGEFRWHITRQVAIRDSSDDIIRWLGTCTDIHDQRTAAELLSRDAQVLAGVHESVIVTDLDGTVTYWNQGATRLFGFQASEVLHQPCSHGFPVPLISEIARTIRETGNAEEWCGEFEERRKDGSRAWIYVRVSPLTDAAGQAVGILGLAYDLTDRKRAEESLAAVMRSVPDSIITIDHVGTIRSANPAVETMFGYKESELLGRNINVLTPEPHASAHDRYIRDFLRTGISRVIGTGREVEALRKDGTTFPAELSVTECRIEGDRHFTGVVRNITERKKLEEQFRQAQKMEAIGRLAGGVAHDFNNLLTVINGYSDLLLPTIPDTHPHRAPLAAIHDAGQRAASLTSQLLAFSRKAIVTPRVLDLNEVISLSERLLKRLIGEDIILASSLSPMPSRIEADPNQLDQVIMNLAVNARDAMPTGGRLTLETRRITLPTNQSTDSGELRSGPYVQLTVRDTGGGMTDEVKSKLFEPFFTTKGPGKGTGLGLAVVHGVVKQAGGHIMVESEVGKGATFRILFPEIPSLQTETSHGSVYSVRRGEETVLLVEDEDAVRALCQIALESQGYTVLSAANGREALEQVGTHGNGIQILVTDVVMPEMSGRDLALAVRKKVPGIQVLFVSGYTDDSVIRHGIREATDAFLQKPFTPLGLARKVRGLLDGTP